MLDVVASTRPKLSVCLVTQNAAPLLPRLLANVEGVADEIVAVDGGSSDGSQEILQAHAKVRFFQRPFDGRFAEQKNFAFDAARGEWILIVDSDELLGDRLRAKIPDLVRTQRYTHYKFARYWVLTGPPWTYVRSSTHFPDFQLRLFRNLPVFRYAPDRMLHHHFPADGRGRGKKCRRLHLFHFDFVVADRAARERKFRRYSEIEPQTTSTSRMYLYEDFDYRERRCREPLAGVQFDQPVAHSSRRS
ncbi:MAG: glycosyltransferase family 2 protein [Planctomycetes bacterium]|nr:glycosyltransferase family 2 protein [Planctomycetota bacterium]MBI3844985.1 glycosyltransferase family 2 protein [Planctomycetota bacterium]